MCGNAKMVIAIEIGFLDSNSKFSTSVEILFSPVGVFALVD
jgi:hypothetical protein